jgi:hypothetical protein
VKRIEIIEGPGSALFGSGPPLTASFSPRGMVNDKIGPQSVHRWSLSRTVWMVSGTLSASSHGKKASDRIYHGHRDSTLILIAFRHGLRPVYIANLWTTYLPLPTPTQDPGVQHS